jgi:hypothetical protein
MLPSLNQIGFDYMDWIAGPVLIGEPGEQGQGKLILWAIGGRPDGDGVLVADPESDFALPLSGVYKGNRFVLSNRSFKMAVTGIPIPFRLFQIRGQLAPDLRVLPGATAYADAKVLAIPTFGPLLVLAGLANSWWQKLLPFGTYVTRPYPAAGPADKRPGAIVVTGIEYTAPTRRRDGQVVATCRVEPGADYRLDQHRPAILLIDTNASEAVYLDYQGSLTSTADAVGNLSTVSLTIPAGTTLPDPLAAVVMLDVFPMAHFGLPNARGGSQPPVGS